MPSIRVRRGCLPLTTKYTRQLFRLEKAHKDPVKNIMMPLLLVCALFIGQNRVEAEDSESEAIRPFPLVDIRQV